jgi:ADP-ribose pyrophosphatase YjhB (NUDIX family)
MKKNPYYYIGENPGVDLIVINPLDEILIIRRSSQSEVYPSMLAFPGGFINSKALIGEVFQYGLETPEEAALRELAEETNLKLSLVNLKTAGVYTGNNRDPRDNEFSWAKSFAFIFLIDQQTFDGQKNLIKGMDDAEDAKWIKISTLLDMELVFDHKQILKDAINLLGKN